jgi:hypothetical protein
MWALPMTLHHGTELFPSRYIITHVIQCGTKLFRQRERKGKYKTHSINYGTGTK